MIGSDGRRLSLPGPAEHAGMLVKQVGIEKAMAHAASGGDGSVRHWMLAEHYRRVGFVLLWMRAVEQGA